MYKRKLYTFGFASAFALVIALSCAAVSAHITRTNLEQSSIAQTLLSEHLQLSSTSYRLFKQLTDELIFGQNANQAEVRNKQQLIEQSVAKIRQLELDQREALGEASTQGSVEDTDALKNLIDQIIAEFKTIVSSNDTAPLSQQNRVRRLLEVTIDNQFREAINAAVMRQGRVVAATNARIDTLNTTIMWFTASLGLLACPFIFFGCYWLFNQLYHPLNTIRSGTEAIAAGNYQYRIPDGLDQEFQDIVAVLNHMAVRLAEHETNESQLRRHLEFEVAQRTRELTEANRQLTLLDSRRRQFIADVSHELRTPLTIIRGEAQVTLRHNQADIVAYQDSMKAILQQAVNLSRLVDDLLLLARAEMSELKLELRNMLCGELIEELSPQWQRLHPERQLRIIASETLKNHSVWIDPHRFSQACAILIDNAAKYSAQDKPIEIQAHCQDSAMRLSVSDWGEGISPTDLQHIFERFVRFNPRGEGMGLGLAIARAIMDAHDGDISVESTPGLGSVFTLTVPLKEQA